LGYECGTPSLLPEKPFLDDENQNVIDYNVKKLMGFQEPRKKVTTVLPDQVTKEYSEHLQAFLWHNIL
jgi:hypothetical protein